MNIEESRHFSQERMQQRGVSHSLKNLLLEYGAIDYGHRGAYYKFFSRRSIEKMISVGVDRRLIQEAEKKINLRVVVSTDTCKLITVKHATSRNIRIKHNEFKYY